MEARLAKTASNLLLLLFNSLFRDMEKFITKVGVFWACDEQVFQKFPCNGQQINSDVEEGALSIAEVNGMMKRLGMVKLEEDSSTSVGAQDVVALFEEEEPSFDEIKETFRMFDANNDGFIDATDLLRVLSNIGFMERYGLGECKTMIRAYDSNGDGLIDFQDFVKFMEKCLC